MKDYSKIKKDLLRRSKVKKAYDELRPEFEVVALLTEVRLGKRLSQRELAARIGTQQSAISRLESGTYNPSLYFLYRVAEALNARLKISLQVK